jgi:hypothetical protein
MKRILSVLLPLLTISSSALAVMATHTGRMQYGTSVTGQAIVKCEYTTGGANKFWVTIKGAFCPATIEVE